MLTSLSRATGGYRPKLGVFEVYHGQDASLGRGDRHWKGDPHLPIVVFR